MTPRATTPTKTRVHAHWRGARLFEVQASAGAAIILDGAKVAGPGPVDALLGALAACSAIDIVDYLAKRRTPVEQFNVVVTAERRVQSPRRVRRAQLEFRIRGAAIDATHAKRAIELSLDRYCSVAATLARDLRVMTTLVLNGTAYPARSRRRARTNG